jgi:hypothetical protein
MTFHRKTTNPEGGERNCSEQVLAQLAEHHEQRYDDGNIEH